MWQDAKVCRIRKSSSSFTSHALLAVNQKENFLFTSYSTADDDLSIIFERDWARHQTIISDRRNISIISYLSVTDTFYKHHKNVKILSETSTRRGEKRREDIKIQTSHKYILHHHHHSTWRMHIGCLRLQKN